MSTSSKFTCVRIAEFAISTLFILIITTQCCFAYSFCFNIDIKNNTGKNANNIELTLGSKKSIHVVDTFDGGYIWPLFNEKTTYINPGLVNFSWYNPYPSDVIPGQIAHVGAWGDVESSPVIVNNFYWTYDNLNIGNIDLASIIFNEGPGYNIVWVQTDTFNEFFEVPAFKNLANYGNSSLNVKYAIRHVDDFVPLRELNSMNQNPADYSPFVDITLAPVPEPTTFFLLAVGLAGIGFMHKNKIRIIKQI